jgi:hypothetical protein
MTNSTIRIMRHIPEEELHAYLDQALSRSQCVEIERHLAGCLRCSTQRDDIAALRDRTTAFLAELAPPPIAPPAYLSLVARYDEARRRRRRRLVGAGWAASLFLSATVGWQASRWTGDHAMTGAPPETRPPETAAMAPPAPPFSGIQEASPEGAQPVVRNVTTRDSRIPIRTADFVERSWLPDDRYGAAPLNPEIEVSALRATLSTGEAGTTGLWRTVPLGALETEAQLEAPRITGLPVVLVQVQHLRPNADVTAVDQQLASGEIIRVIEGPVSDVANIISRQSPTPPPSDSIPIAFTHPHTDATLTLRRGDRMVAVTGPTEMLSSLMTRVHSRTLTGR